MHVRLGQLTIPLKITEREEIICESIGRLQTDGNLSTQAANSMRKDWTAKLVASERARILVTFQDHANREGFDAAFNWLNQLVDGQKSESDIHYNLTGFCAALLILEIDLQDDFLTAPKRKRLYELVETILKVQGIDADSRLGYLVSHLKHLRALDAVRQGRPWLAFFDQVLAWQSGRRSNHSRLQALTALTTALRAMRLGQTDLALSGLNYAEQVGLDDSALILARLTRIQILRLRQNCTDALQLIDETRKTLHLGQEAVLELTWEEAVIAGILEGGDTWRNLFNLCRRGRPHYEVTYLLEAHLWARAMPSLKFLEILPKLATIKSKAGVVVTRNLRFSMLINVLNCLDTVYEAGIQAPIKIAAVAAVSDNLTKLPGVDRELLATLALARWAHRQNLNLPSSLLLGAYQNLCQSLSGGRSSDVLALAPKLSVSPWE